MAEKTLAMHKKMYKAEKAFQSLSSLFICSDCSYSTDTEQTTLKLRLSFCTSSFSTVGTAKN